MPYLTVDQFKQTLANDPPAAVTQQYVFAGVPYVFRDEPASNDLLISYLSENMGIPQRDIVVVGSAKLGFSLNPDTFPRAFSDTSDIDILVVSQELFDRIWMILLEWSYPRRGSDLGRVEGGWARLRRKDVYWGWCVPDQIYYEGLSFPHVLKPLRDIAVKWFNTFQSLSLYPEFAAHTMSGRLYRTWDHALQYHADGIRRIRDRIMTAQKGE